MDQGLTLASGTTRATINPLKGAVISSFEVDGKDVLFPDSQLDVGGAMKRRGGSPVLFPQAGPLPEGGPYALPQHGYARTQPWMVSSHTDASLGLTLVTDSLSTPEFPFSLAMEFRVSVEPGRLIQRLAVTNRSDTAVPLAPGFHPYFSIPERDRARLRTNIHGFDPSAYLAPETLFFPVEGPIELFLPSGPSITLTASDQFKVLAVWSEPDRDFLCVEPWVGAEGALLDPGSAVSVEPGSTEVFAFAIEVS